MSPQAVTPLPRAGPSIPDYELLRPIGRGAYGEVWLARNVTGSWVALKIVHRSAFDHDRPFEREFEGIKRFEPISRSDPSQVAILHVGLGEGFFYYVMELADDAAERGNGVMESGSDGSTTGQHHSTTPSLQHSITPASYAPLTLKHLLNDRGALPADECLAIALSLTGALAHLHGHGLVHRDVKPSNVIFVNGVARLADIGLVTSVDATRSFVGTEGYLPPEGAGTPQADLYSLGKLLYEMSTGCDRKEFPALPPDIATRPDRDALAELNAIVVRACQLDVGERYQTAEELHADLAFLQRGESVKGRRVIERRRILAKKLLFSLAAVAVLAVGAWALSTKLAWRNPDATRARLGVKKSPAPEVLRLCKLGGEAAAKGTKESLTEAFELLNRAIALDPGYVPAYLGLAGAYNAAPDWLLPSRQALPEVKRAATSALQIDPSSAGALQWLGVFKMEFEWDWAGAEIDFKRAIQLGAKEPWPHSFYATLLLNLNRLPEARIEQERALQLEPNNPAVISGMVRLYFVERDFDRALDLALKGRREHTNSFAFPILLAWIYEEKGMYPQALAELRAIRAIDDGPDFVAFLGYMYAAGGDKERARELLKELQGMSGRLVPQYFVGLVHIGLGDSDAAIGCLQRAVAENSASLSGAGPFLPIAIDPHFDSLRSDPRFIALLRKMGLEK